MKSFSPLTHSYHLPSDTTLQQVCIHLRGTTSISYLRTLEKEITLFQKSVDPSCRTCCEVGVQRVLLLIIHIINYFYKCIFDLILLNDPSNQ